MAESHITDEAGAATAASASGASAQNSVGRRAARGATVVYAGQAVRIALQVVSVSVLARLLTPSDYGLLAIVLAVVGVGEIFRDFGLSTAAIQARSLSAAQRSTLFWLNTGIGAVLTVIVWFGAPLVADIFGYRQLVGISHALAFTFLINGMSAQYRAGLNRSLRFKAVIGSDVLGQLVGIVVAVIAATQGAGYWALVAQQLSQALLVLVLLVVLGRWLPGRAAPIAAVRPMIRYGWHLAGSQLVYYLDSNVDTFTISFRFGATPLGLYNRGFQLLMRPLGQLRGPSNNVAVPVLARLHDDVDRANSYVVTGQLMFGYTLLPMLAVAFGAAHPIVQVFLGDRWAPVAPVVAALAAAGAFQCLAFVGSWVYQARGLTPQLLRYTFISLGIKIVCVLLGSNFGITGVAIGYAVAPGLAWPLSLWLLSRVTPLPYKQLWAGAGRILGCAVPAALAGRLVTGLVPTHHLLAIGLSVAAVIAVYAALSVVPPIRRDLGRVLGSVRTAVAR